MARLLLAVVSEHTDTYNCQVDQMIMGIDQIRQTDLQRRMGPAIRDPKQQRTKNDCRTGKYPSGYAVCR